MFSDVSSCNTYNYSDALYWDSRYIQEAASFDWYQRYSALRPFIRKYVSTSSRVLMVGCGNADYLWRSYSKNASFKETSVQLDNFTIHHTPGHERPPGSMSAVKSDLEPVPLTEEGLLPPGFVLEDPDCHYIYVCQKADRRVHEHHTRILLGSRFVVETPWCQQRTTFSVLL